MSLVVASRYLGFGLMSAALLVLAGCSKAPVPTPENHNVAQADPLQSAKPIPAEKQPADLPAKEVKPSEATKQPGIQLHPVTEPIEPPPLRGLVPVKRVTVPDSEGANDVAFTPAGNLLAFAGIRPAIWDIKAGQRQQFEDSKNLAQAVLFADQGKTMISAGAGQEIIVWDVASGKQKNVIKVEADSVRSLALSPDGKTLVHGFDEGAKVLDFPSGKERLTLKMEDSPKLLAFVDGGKRLIAVSFSKWYTFDLTTGKGMENQPEEGPLAVTDSGKLAVFHESGERDLMVRELTGNKEVARLTGLTAFVTCAAIAPDGKTVAAYDFEGIVRIWDMPSGRLRGGIRARGIDKLRFSADGQQLAACGFGDDVSLWQMEEGVLPPLPRHLVVAETLSTGNEAYDVDMSANGKVLAAGGKGGIKLWDLATRKPLGHIEVEDDYAMRVALSPDGSLVAWRTERSFTAHVAEVPAGKLKHTLEGHSGAVRDLIFTPDGKSLITGSSDGTIKLWDMSSGKETGSLSGHGEVRSVALAPTDPNLLASGGFRIAAGESHGEAKLWDLKMMKETAALPVKGNRISCVSFSADGK
ncbi:MAG: WD40 repeat domain-containing protein, partial [Gemmataceae bacterium]